MHNNEVVCECGHSIEKHTQLGREVKMNDIDGSYLCPCGLSRNALKARHQLKQMTAERDKWHSAYEIESKLRRQDFTEHQSFQSNVEDRLDLAEKKIDALTKKLSEKQEIIDSQAGTIANFAFDGVRLAKKLEVAIGGLDWIKALFVENGEYNEATEKVDEIKTEIAQPDNLYKDVSDSITASGESDAKQEAE